MAYSSAHPCGYETCDNIIPRTSSGGREKKFCNSTCRSAQHRLDEDRAATQRVKDEQERRFQTIIAGTHPLLQAGLREVLRRNGEDGLYRAVALVKQAQALGNVKAYSVETLQENTDRGLIVQR